MEPSWIKCLYWPKKSQNCNIICKMIITVINKKTGFFFACILIAWHWEMYISTSSCLIINDDIIKWKHVPRKWPFVREHTCDWWIPLTKDRDAELWCFLDLSLNKWLSKQSRSRSLWRHCNKCYNLEGTSFPIKQLNCLFSIIILCVTYWFIQYKITCTLLLLFVRGKYTWPHETSINVAHVLHFTLLYTLYAAEFHPTTNTVRSLTDAYCRIPYSV